MAAGDAFIYVDANVGVSAVDRLSAYNYVDLLSMAAGYATEVIPDAPLAYYRFNDPTNSATAADSSGNGRAATWQTVGGTGLARVAGLLAGDSDGAASLDGGTRATVANAPWMNVTSYTLEAVIRPTLGAVRAIIDRDPDTSNRVFQFRVEADGKLGFIFWTNAGGPFFCTSTAAMTNGNTYHVAATYDGATARVYINGAESGTLAQAGGGRTNTAARLQLAVNSISAAGFVGVLDEAAIYGTALPAARIQAHYQATTGLAALSGSGQLSASVVPASTGLVGLSGSGQLTVSGKPNLAAPVALSGSGQLSVVGTSLREVALSGSGQLSVITGLETFADIGFSGEGTLGYVPPFDPDDPSIPVQLVFSIVDDSLIQAPTVVVVSVRNGDPGEMYVFRIDGDVVYSARALPSGDLAMTSIPVTEEHGAAGPHTISVTQGSLYGTDTFTIRRAPNLTETVMGPDTAPVEPSSGVYRANGTRLWVLQDLMPGGLGTYILPVNPAEMDNPAFERALSTRHATAKNGQWHIYEGAPTPLDWSFQGYCPTQEMHDKLHAFGTLNRRFYLIDHRERAWIVSFSQVDAVARLRENDIYGQESDWVHDYTVTAQIYSQHPGRAQ